MNKATILNPTQLSNEKLAKIYERHPGPYVITTGWKTDLEKIFPGIMEIGFDIDKVGRPHYGDINESETELLYRIVNWLQPKNLVEFGTFDGRSTRIMAEQSPLDARVLTVDLPEDNGFIHPYTSDSIFSELAKPGSRYEGSSATGKIKQVLMDATSFNFKKELDTFLDGKSIDFALVDAAHDYYTTKYLWELAFSKLNPGGVILSDDYGKIASHIGVTEFFATKAREDGFLFYHFKPEPKEAKDPSGVFFVNVYGAIRNWKKG